MCDVCTERDLSRRTLLLASAMLAAAPVCTENLSPDVVMVNSTYARYYDDIRTHRSLNKDAPVSRPVQRTGVISSHAILCGLHHHYART
jgi:hypothetical protein